MKHVDVIVVGGGHAGLEAAAAAVRSGCDVALVTMRREDLGTMSCNPAIGGVGKGHLVREVDALDGLMAKLGDAAAIQFRLLNRRKGPAVRGPRVQADRLRYKHATQSALRSLPALSVITGEAVGLVRTGTRVTGVRLVDGATITGKSVVLATGTFLGARIHIGRETFSSGRMGDRAAGAMADSLRDLGLHTRRLKTGTPPRLDGRTIAWERLDLQESDSNPTFLSFLSRSLSCPQMVCAVTHSNRQTHDIIRENLHRSALYSGEISGPGPRYCPSIEDKIVRFSDKESHQIFLEPEGLTTTTVYPNGVSTSLPADVQEQYLRSICGLESVAVTQPGYAVEYDYLDPRGLDHGLAVKGLPNLFFAGQINGTTGYEEAAAQGLVAGLNAARHARGLAPVRFSRTSSYIGVMIDDLVSNGAPEPYRMFTSRAEFRLSLRADNADQRLTPFGRDMGLVGEVRWAAFDRKRDALECGRKMLEDQTFSPRALAAGNAVTRRDGRGHTAHSILALPEGGRTILGKLQANLPSPEILDQLEIEAQYEPYLDRQNRDAEALARDEAVRLPVALVYQSVAGLSGELREKLAAARPETLADARRISGMTPAALTLLAALARRMTYDRCST